MNQPFEFRVWDIPNKKFLTELQTDYGEWVWSQGSKYDPGKSSWHWVFEHIEDFVVTMAIGWEDMDKKKIFVGDIVECWDDDPSGQGYSYNHVVGVIEYYQNYFGLKRKIKGTEQLFDYSYSMGWINAKYIRIKGNIFEHPERF